MKDETPITVHRGDYIPPVFAVESIELHFELAGEETKVHATSQFRRRDGESTAAPLVLDGQDMKLLRLAIDGQELSESEYTIGPETLQIDNVPNAFTLEITSGLDPTSNKSLEGLYVSSDNYCTQCEAEGFRKITWFPDRPDVMTRFRTRITANKKQCPILLSNGNRVESGDLDADTHYAVWEDPFPKPCYLFALVAGDLVYREDHFVTMTGKKVTLQIFVEKGNLEKTEHCMISLKNSMTWDEKRFGREYDLDIFMLVAVGDFNMGAMENKGLNIFNSKYVLAEPDTATDYDYQNIEGIVGHEYFHNWSGNRVTCRDWFQLSLKEGFTVFRDQEFSADMGSRAVKRIADVSRLRAGQFPEDAGPTAHPVRPDSYLEISNFYTATVYEKGAEVVRILHSILGEENFRKGTDLYFERHDGQAVTCEDFAKAMEDANGVDLTQFRLWYSQSGTPRVIVSSRYDKEQKTFHLDTQQVLPPTPGQPEKDPMVLPMRVGLIGQNATDLPLQLEGETMEGETPTCRTLHITESKQSFTFVNIPSRPVASLFRNFSAPIHLETDHSLEDWIFQMANDSDPFNRWEASQTLSTRIILEIVSSLQNKNEPYAPEAYIRAFGSNLAKSVSDPALFSRILSLPSEIILAESMEVIDSENIYLAKDWLIRSLAVSYAPLLEQVYHELNENAPYSIEPSQIGKRALRNTCLRYLMCLTASDQGGLAANQYHKATNMTDRMAALACLSRQDRAVREAALADFYGRWKSDPLVIDKWFELQAISPREETLAEVQNLTRHSQFNIKNPNKVRALIGSFAIANPYRFHTEGEKAYVFLADQILLLDTFNPQIAARLLTPLARWRRFDEARQEAMTSQLRRLIGRKGVSKDVYEIVSKSLG
jgi:aminopeptidase N